ncbi:MAG: hypothetical protein QM780_02925 [Hyphomicrobium sp.]|uniref:esterase/lipase family protein n=1 Tax=Hyphomicrobium sp. TaxID=82 RepID=UPI0039E4691B
MADRETVVLVHGTFSGPRDGIAQWYDRGETFCTKLNAALEARGSSARCWAHADPTAGPFSWSGRNQWADRVESATDFAQYVSDLQHAGWTCHVVAHSHGGNIVTDALPTIYRQTGHPGGINGTVTTLGTPFLDTLSPFERKRRRRSLIGAGRTIFALFLVWAVWALLFFGAVDNDKGIWKDLVFMPRPNGEPANVMALPIDVSALILLPLTGWTIYRAFFTRRRPGFWEATKVRSPFFLVLTSKFDEAWQLLHHLHATANPLKPKSGWTGFLDDGRKRFISRLKTVEKLHGKATFGMLPRRGKIMVAIIYALTTWLFASSTYMGFTTLHRLGDKDEMIARFAASRAAAFCAPQKTNLPPMPPELCVNQSFDSILFPTPQGPVDPSFRAWVESPEGQKLFQAYVATSRSALASTLLTTSIFFIGLMYLFAALLAPIGGGAYFSALFSPVRAVLRTLRSLFTLPSLAANYIVRERGWNVIQQLAFGLEGYAYRIPPPEQMPTRVPAEFMRFEELDSDATERALNNRSNWFVRNFGDLTETLSKMVLTASDISFLQRMIETDAQLVHGVYYTDDDVIARIADWIAKAPTDTEAMPQTR